MRSRRVRSSTWIWLTASAVSAACTLSPGIDPPYNDDDLSGDSDSDGYPGSGGSSSASGGAGPTGGLGGEPELGGGGQGGSP